MQSMRLLKKKYLIPYEFLNEERRLAAAGKSTTFKITRKAGEASAQHAVEF